MKALVGTFNQEKAYVEALSVSVKLQTSQRFVSSSSVDSISAAVDTVSCLLRSPGARARPDRLRAFRARLTAAE